MASDAVLESNNLVVLNGNVTRTEVQLTSSHFSTSV